MSLLPPLVWQNALLTFALSLILGAVLGLIVILPFLLSLFLLLAMIVLGIIFDMVGVAVAAASEKPLHAMAADKVPGSGQAIWLVRRAGRVANICNDVVGDVSGTISGAITAALAVRLAVRWSFDQSVLTVVTIALVAALTVGGKALGKVYALRQPHLVMIKVGNYLVKLGLSVGNRRGRARRPKERQNQGRR